MHRYKPTKIATSLQWSRAFIRSYVALVIHGHAVLTEGYQELLLLLKNESRRFVIL